VSRPPLRVKSTDHSPPPQWNSPRDGCTRARTIMGKMLCPALTDRLELGAGLSGQTYFRSRIRPFSLHAKRAAWRPPQDRAAVSARTHLHGSETGNRPIADKVIGAGQWLRSFCPMTGPKWDSSTIRKSPPKRAEVAMIGWATQSSRRQARSTKSQRMHPGHERVCGHAPRLFAAAQLFSLTFR
jgi:hypothetical protein